MDFIIQVIWHYIYVVVMGGIFLIVGIVIPVFKAYWLIAGVNTASEEQLSKIDLKYVSKYLGIFLASLGLLIVLNPFVLSYLNLTKYIIPCLLISIFSMVAFMFIFGRIKKDRINKHTAG